MHTRKKKEEVCLCLFPAARSESKIEKERVCRKRPDVIVVSYSTREVKGD